MGNRVETSEINIPPNFPQDKLVLHMRAIPSDSSKTLASIQDEEPGHSPDEAEGLLPADTLWLENILFSFDKSTLSSIYFTSLNFLANLMTRYPETLLKITGYTDAIGNEEYNLKLSLDRAMTVAQYLKKMQVDPSRLTVKGLGESIPVALNANPDGTDNPAGRNFNRRVEMQISLLPVNWVVIKKDITPASLKSR